MLSPFIFVIVITLGLCKNESKTEVCHRFVPRNLTLSSGSKGWLSCRSLNKYLPTNGDPFSKFCSIEQHFGLKCAKRSVQCGSKIALCIEENPLYRSQFRKYQNLNHRIKNWSSFKFNTTLALARQLRPPKSGDNGAFDAVSNAWLRRHHPEAFKRIKNSSKQNNISQATLACIMVQLCQLLNINNTSIRLVGRIKSIYSIWIKEQRILAKEENTELVTDQLSIKIIVNTEDDCYTVKNILANTFTVFRINDYISNPKSSGYRAIHVILFGYQDDQFVEIQIVTDAMNQAQMGDDHSRYKTNQDTLLYE